MRSKLVPLALAYAARRGVEVDAVARELDVPEGLRTPEAWSMDAPALPIDRVEALLDRLANALGDPGFGEAQALGVGDAAGGEEDAVDLHIVMLGHADLEGAVVLFLDPAEFGVEAEIDALGHRNLQQPVADLFVIAAQDDI